MNGKGYLWGELLTLFGVVPLVYFLSPVHLPKIPLLLVFFFGCLFALRRSESFDQRELLHPLRGHGESIKWIVARAALVAVLCLGVVALLEPALLFGFPRTRPWLWLMVMVLYPLLSAYPQELIYRAFFFHRYRAILPSEAGLVWASTLAFAFLHVIFGNWVAVGLTIPAGYLFSRTYVRTGSLFLASIEHALYGCIIFTTGLGRYFYTPS
ncbi:CPBP family intramembrane metalloprotease [Pseudodesulfovibrio cashew]|uniref:CPBP family intramembrane metalloprotease n=1 Tax=Pseudodesulfovibrio cashew TaxID=2678688 RepID=A0A6I6JNC8_9BACT|nr:CPBP family intramembrane glutamic endopeptidase [Pseudodesulfovibrio cashew]QGY41593.1 CPBP family intramembrane metalloprotease [Pseudodesulfovibrio cashew]